MHAEGFFAQAVVYLGAAVIAVPLAKRLGLGSVLGYLAAGIAIGPFGLGLVGEEGKDVLHFAEFGVVMMLFVIGLELQPSLLWGLRKPILGLGGLQVIATALVVAGLARAFGLPPGTAIAIGLILAMSSTAIVLQTLEEKGLMKTEAGQSSFAVLLFQDLAVIPVLAILPLLAGSPAADTETAPALPSWAQTLVVLGAVSAVVLAGLFLVRPLLRLIAKTGLREMFTAASLLLVVGTATLMMAVGLSPALGAFLAGVVLANSEFRHELETDIEPFKGLLLGLFFIAVGAGIDFRLVAAEPAAVVALVVLLVIAKLAVLLALARAFRLSTDQGLLFSFALAQGGEFCFVLLSFATQRNVLPAAVSGPLTAVVALSMALTPLLLLLAERVVLPRVGTRERPEREPDAIDQESPVIIAGFGRFGHIVGRLLTASGIRTTVLDVDSDQVDLLRKLGIKVFYGDASRVDLLRTAGAGQAKLFVLAVDEREKALDIARTVKKHFPQLTILARAHGRNHAYELIDAGVAHVYRETLDASLSLGVDALRMVGVPGHEAVRSARTFRRHDEDSVRELAAMRGDRAAYFTRARERIRDLEELMRADRDEVASVRDAAWDTDSLRREFASPPKSTRDTE